MTRYPISTVTVSRADAWIDTGRRLSEDSCFSPNQTDLDTRMMSSSNRLEAVTDRSYDEGGKRAVIISAMTLFFFVFD